PRSIIKLTRANHATQPIAQSAALASATVPPTNYPEEKNRRKKNQQVDRNQCGETDANHGAVLSVRGRVEGGRTMSLPHSTVTRPQVGAARMEDGGLRIEGKRQSARYFRACSSRLASPEDFSRKQERTSPKSFTATRNCAASGDSRPDAVNFSSGLWIEPRASSSGEKRKAVGTIFGAVGICVRGRSTAAGG